MENTFTIPEELRLPFQRLLPYMSPGLRSDQNGLEAVLLYLKLGGEKLARAAIDAYNQTLRLKTAELQKLRLEEALLADRLDDDEEEDDDDEEDEEEDEESEDDY